MTHKGRAMSDVTFNPESLTTPDVTFNPNDPPEAYNNPTIQPRITK
jgi:hypothetical protein